ncbi:gluconokinase [Nakamurella lactea]|uniref:gluconokinase n=1 Tax=Nakamurella lactea TaxID=459515 RepID=UPI0004206C79|nr:gluconokinase [Nakamurella lactea]
MSPTVLVVMGVSGSGKTTLAKTLSEKFGWEYGEGDDLHPRANVEKMAAGHPLTDEDRWPWLDRISVWIGDHLAAGRSGVITCSALRRRYRNRLSGTGVVFLYLHGSYELIDERMKRRKDHYMPESLLHSQFDTLEEPGDDENVVVVELGGTPQEEADRAIQALREHGVDLD